MPLINKNSKIDFSDQGWVLVFPPLFNAYSDKWRTSHSTRTIRIYESSIKSFMYFYLVTIKDAKELIELCKKDPRNSSKPVFLKLPDNELKLNSSEEQIKDYINKYNKQWEVEKLEKYNII